MPLTKPAAGSASCDEHPTRHLLNDILSDFPQHPKGLRIVTYRRAKDDALRALRDLLG